MISLLSMSVHVLASTFTYILKAFFSLFTWFLKALYRAGRLLFVVLPVTSLVLTALLCFNIFLLCSGGIDLSSSGATSSEVSQGHVIDLPADLSGGTVLEQEADEMIKDGGAQIVLMYRDLKSWWIQQVYSLRGSIGYVFLLLLTILMFIPVITVLLCICVLMSYGHILFIGVIFDAAIYMVRAVLGKSFISQALGRYYRLFPDAGRRHEERYHDKLLKQRNRELEGEIRLSKQKKQMSFYEDDDMDSYPEDEDYEDYPEEYEDDEDYPDEYEDDEDYPEEYEDNEDYPDEYEDDEDYPEDYSDEDDYFDEYENEFGNGEDSAYDEYDDKDKSRRSGSDNRSGSSTFAKASGSFNFFAGCNSLESAERKYKSLVKLYHPDNMDGDTAALQEINAQYAEIKKKF